jgi:hypothetical protein
MFQGCSCFTHKGATTALNVARFATLDSLLRRASSSKASPPSCLTSGWIPRALKSIQTFRSFVMAVLGVCSGTDGENAIQFRSSCNMSFKGYRSLKIVAS